jgi:hypothetical protein
VIIVVLQVLKGMNVEVSKYNEGDIWHEKGEVPQLEQQQRIFIDNEQHSTRPCDWIKKETPRHSENAQEATFCKDDYETHLFKAVHAGNTPVGSYYLRFIIRP